MTVKNKRGSNINNNAKHLIGLSNTNKRARIFIGLADGDARNVISLVYFWKV